MKQNSFFPARFRRLSGSALKLIAALSMLIDHFAVCFKPLLESPRLHLLGRTVTPYLAMRFAGRIAFPLFCFLLTEGFRHTRDRRRYGLVLLLFALLSELPFDLFNMGAFGYERQNVFFTLLLGYLGIWAIESFRREQWKALISVLVLFAVAWRLGADYGWRGFLFILVVYLLCEEPVVQGLASSALLSWRVGVGLAFVPINLYNGERGFVRSPWLKYGFYAFYPLHLLLFWQLHLHFFGY